MSNAREYLRITDPTANPDTYLDPADGRRTNDGPMLVRARLYAGHTVRCILCGKWTGRVLADVNGRPFEDFYCDHCVEEALKCV